MGLKQAKEIYDKYNWNSSNYRQMPTNEFRLYIMARYFKIH